MDAFEAINGRRSIRRFSDRPVPREMIETILQAGIEAPSAKNAQPWRFVVVENEAKTGMVDAMRAGIEAFDGDPAMTKWPQITMRVMRAAPATIFVLNPFSRGMTPPEDLMGMVGTLALTQSVGAAVQNMCLAAHALGLGTLWICDIFFAYKELGAWLSTDEQIVCALSVGYANEAPDRRPRKALADVVTWRG